MAIITLTSRQTLKAQITLVHTYDSASAITSPGGQLFMVNFEVEGLKYVNFQYPNNSKIIQIYNLDHSLYKTINIPFPSYYIYPSILYISEHLFNTDDLMEYMITYQDVNYQIQTRIFNELGDTLFAIDSAGPVVSQNVPQMMYPIYNTPNGTIMIMSMQNGHANVYSLTGHLSASIQPINNSSNNQMLENIYPNPSTGNTTIEFNLPQGVNQGEVIIYTMQGQELKSYKVDNTFHTLLLNNSEFHAGTYFYQLQTASGASGAKKMIVIKN